MNLAALRALLNGDLENATVASTPGGIEAQEAAGQATLVASNLLPKDGAEILSSFGITYTDSADPLFVTAKLPEGWTKRATEHSMWSELIDNNGVIRADIFYKAAFYDRHAHMRIHEATD